MNYLQPIAHGLDYWIQLFQIRLYNLCLTLPTAKGGLGLTDSNCLCFGRAERNNVDQKGYMPEVFYNGQYIGSDGKSSRGGLFFEKGAFILFFHQLENRKTANFDYIARMEMIVFTDMSVITPQGNTSSTQRLTEVLLAQLERFTTYNGCGFEVKQTTFNIDKVLENYSGAQKRNTLIQNLSDSTNNSSFGALKLTLELHYDPGQA